MKKLRKILYPLILIQTLIFGSVGNAMTCRQILANSSELSQLFSNTITGSKASFQGYTFTTKIGPKNLPFEEDGDIYLNYEVYITDSSNKAVGKLLGRFLFTSTVLGNSQANYVKINLPDELANLGVEKAFIRTYLSEFERFETDENKIHEITFSFDGAIVREFNSLRHETVEAATAGRLIQTSQAMSAFDFAVDYVDLDMGSVPQGNVYISDNSDWPTVLTESLIINYKR